MGLSTAAIDQRVKHGRLCRLHRGVYLVGPVAPPLARAMAAVLACGPGAFLSHRSAGVLWGLLRDPGRPRKLDVTVVGRNPGPKAGISLHRVPALERVDVRPHRGIPITAPARTLLDLAAETSEAEVEQALAEAFARRLVRRADVDSVLARNLGHRGRKALAALLESERPPSLTRSQAERRFLELVRRGGLPPPESNVHVGAHEVDFLWREQRLVVEVDGFRFHSSRPAFERDRRRDAELQATRHRVIRVTWSQIVREPEALLVRIARVLGQP